MLTITIDRELDEPVYGQVADQIRRLVAAGKLRPGTRLPPVRRLARDLGVNLNTIARAYRLLESEGFLEIRDRAGAVVAAPSALDDEETVDRLLEELGATLARLGQAGMRDDERARAMLSEFLAPNGRPQETRETRDE